MYHQLIRRSIYVVFYLIYYLLINMKCVSVKDPKKLILIAIVLLLLTFILIIAVSITTKGKSQRMEVEHLNGIQNELNLSLDGNYAEYHSLEDYAGV